MSLHREHFECIRDLTQLRELKGYRLLFLITVVRLDPFEHLPDALCAGWVDKSMLGVPLRDRRKAVFQRVDRQEAGVVREITRDAVPGRGQQAAQVTSKCWSADS